MDTCFEEDKLSRTFVLQRGLNLLLKPVPLPIVDFILSRLVKKIGTNRPEIFNRLEGHHHKWFLIDATNLPFVLCLRPDPLCSELKSYRRRNAPSTESKISGSFLTLLGMIDGRYDGDALFFTRDLCVEGDTEAVVCLRNALDDMDGSIADDVADFFGAPGRRFLKAVRKLSDNDYSARA